MAKQGKNEKEEALALLEEVELVRPRMEPVLEPMMVGAQPLEIPRGIYPVIAQMMSFHLGVATPLTGGRDQFASLNEIPRSVPHPLFFAIVTPTPFLAR